MYNSSSVPNATLFPISFPTSRAKRLFKGKYMIALSNELGLLLAKALNFKMFHVKIYFLCSVISIFPHTHFYCIVYIAQKK